MDPIFAQMSLRPAPKALPVAFKAFVTVLTTTLIMTPSAKRKEVTVTPCFLKISLIRGEEKPFLIPQPGFANVQAPRFFLLVSLPDSFE